MSKTGDVIQAAGTYRSDCCGIERSFQQNQKFPPCDGGRPGCQGNNAVWRLKSAVHAQTK